MADSPDDAPQNKSQHTSTPSSPDSPFVSHIDGYMSGIDGLAELAPLAMVMASGAEQLAGQTYNKFLEDHCKTEGGSYRVPLGVHHKYRRLLRRLEKMKFARKALPATFVVALVSEFDAFLSGLIRLLFLAKPDALNASERSLTLSQLSEIGSVEAAREYIIEKEAEEVLRKSHSDQFSWLENKFGIVLRKDLTAWPDFVELTERRNLFVHTKGRISRQYLEACTHAGVDCSTVKHGDTLDVSPEYLRKAHRIIFEIGVKLALVLWSKVVPKERERLERFLASNIVYVLVESKRYTLAIVFADFGIDVFKKFSSDLQRRVLVVNRAQAYKWSGDTAKANAILLGGQSKTGH